jgi:hypothetical protein
MLKRCWKEQQHKTTTKVIYMGKDIGMYHPKKGMEQKNMVEKTIYNRNVQRIEGMRKERGCCRICGNVGSQVQRRSNR